MTRQEVGHASTVAVDAHDAITVLFRADQLGFGLGAFAHGCSRLLREAVTRRLVSKTIQPRQKARKGRRDAPRVARDDRDGTAGKAGKEYGWRCHLHTFGADLMGLRAGFFASTGHTFTVFSTGTGTSTGYGTSTSTGYGM